MESKVSRPDEDTAGERAGVPAAGPEPGPLAPKTPSGRSSEARPALKVRRLYTEADQDVYDTVEWDRRGAMISAEDGRVVFEQRDIEVPKSWSQLALNVVASKYFRGSQQRPGERESSVGHLIRRVADTISGWGRQDGYFASAEDADSFQAELSYLLLHQMASFNSPVWFNVGVEPRPQCSACFINSVQDSMDSILKLAHTEGMLFKHGSGTGTNLSAIRSSKEELAGGGEASGPVSFMKGYDAFAGVIKSGGKTRRAAKMVILNIDHPDVVEFINCKKDEEQKAWALIDVGYDGSFNGVAYSSVFYQNSNNSVRVTDEFMRAVEEDGEWQTRAITDGRILGTYKARDLIRQIAEAAWVCGDPGMQYDTTVNAWHTCLNTSRINASNPCVTGDTLVATAAGLRRIDELVGVTAGIIGADGQPHLVDRIFPTGRKPVMRLRTKAGYEVRLTADHRVWTSERGDVPVSELRVGEQLALQGAGFGRRVVSERLASAIGVAVGDGCLTRSHAAGRTQEIVILSMAAAEAGVLDAIAGAVNAEKRLKRAVGAAGNPGDVHVGTAGSSARLSFSSQPVVELFKEFAVLDEGSERKRFRPAVFELDQPSQAALLAGLFTADGTVANYGDKSQYVSLDSTSRELLRQTQLLLLGFGIKSKLYEGRRAAGEHMLPDGRGGERAYPVKEMLSLRISRASRFRFEREIGFHPASPKAAALHALNQEFGAYRDELLDAVASIEPSGEEEVFDLTESATEHFVANGLVVHNCSEYMFVDDSACNLASLNLMKFLGDSGEFDVASFRHAVDILITAMEIIVPNSSYPTPAIERNSHDYRPLGLGYANLGALLMARGLAYDSDAGRDYAAAITALLSGQGYLTSAKIARGLGPFPNYPPNSSSMLEVMRKHRRALGSIEPAHVPLELLKGAREAWDQALEWGEAYGYRNSQVSVLAPTGTIGFMMDCDTTGVEPDIALIKYKKLVGGGLLKIVNHTIPIALRRLGYDPNQISEIIAYIDENETIEGAPHLAGEQLPVFDCAFKPQNGKRSIHHMGHVWMMAAVQPFISGAISKTVNMPTDATPDDIIRVYQEGWKLGLKAIAIYRDGCKRTQPLNTGRSKSDSAAVSSSESAAPQAFQPNRRKMPDTRRSITHKFSVGGHEGYITVGTFPDGSPGEIFLVMSKEGSVVSGLMDSFATAISLALQYGVPLTKLVDHFSHTRFEPSGFTKNAEIPYAKSLVDYIFRWLASQFLHPDQQAQVGVVRDRLETGTLDRVESAPPPEREGQEKFSFKLQTDAPPCHVCGAIMVRGGTCYKCLNCGATSGCS